MKRTTLFTLLLLTYNLFAQDGVIQGTVQDRSGEPLWGSNVYLLGTSLGSIDFNLLLHERDKELFCQGQRLIDQNRFPDLLSWHIIGEGTWHYLPVPFEEELSNPNYP